MRRHLSVEFRYCYPFAMSWMRVEHKIYIVRRVSIHYFPDMNDHIPLTSTLEGVKLEVFDALPVVHLLAARYFPSEVSLDVF